MSGKAYAGKIIFVFFPGFNYKACLQEARETNTLSHQ